jgi:hypothetical protein
MNNESMTEPAGDEDNFTEVAVAGVGAEFVNETQEDLLEKIFKSIRHIQETIEKTMKETYLKVFSREAIPEIWTPGSYEIKDLAKIITTRVISSPNNETTTIEPFDSNPPYKVVYKIDSTIRHSFGLSFKVLRLHEKCAKRISQDVLILMITERCTLEILDQITKYMITKNKEVTFLDSFYPKVAIRYESESGIARVFFELKFGGV